MENSKISLLYQLEKRKVLKLERENRALLERISNLLEKEDDERIELLVADKTRRKLVQLRAITERTIKSLESGLNEFRAFVIDIDEAMNEKERLGAIRPLKLDSFNENNDRILHNFSPKLKRIPESPMVWSSTSTSKVGSLPVLGSIHYGMEEEAEEDEKDDEKAEKIVAEMPHLLATTESNGASKENAPISERRESTAQQLPSTVTPICSITLRQRSSTMRNLLTNMKQTHIETPVSSAVSDKMSAYEGEVNAHNRPFSAAVSVPPTPLSSANTSVVFTASGRPKRAAASKIESYHLLVNKKVRRKK